MNNRGAASKKVLGASLLAIVVAAGSAGVYLAENLYYGPMREQQRLVTNLKSIVEQLTKDVRVAQVYVMDQSNGRTKFKFVEVDEKGQRLSEPKVFDIEGDIAYFDTLVIKFDDPFTPINELALKKETLNPELLHKSIIFFRRVFSEKQKPEEGIALDTPNQPPAPYQVREPSDLEKQLWKEFWTLANDPKLAKERGVRAAHGQAVYTQLKKDKYYVLEQRLSGDMTIRPIDVPAVMKP